MPAAAMNAQDLAQAFFGNGSDGSHSPHSHQAQAQQGRKKLKGAIYVNLSTEQCLLASTRRGRAYANGCTVLASTDVCLGCLRA